MKLYVSAKSHTVDFTSPSRIGESQFLNQIRALIAKYLAMIFVCRRELRCWARVRQDTLTLSIYSDSSYSSFLKCKKKIKRTKSPFHKVAHSRLFILKSKIYFLCFEYSSRLSASYTSYRIDIDNFVTVNINFTHIFTLSPHSIFISIFLCFVTPVDNFQTCCARSIFKRNYCVGRNLRIWIICHNY